MIILPTWFAAVSQPAGGDWDAWLRNASSLIIVAVASLAPAAILMATAYVRINVVLALLRQALGHPQIPGNQILTVLALLLTGVVMKPVIDRSYQDGVKPYWEKRITAEQAWTAGSAPIKAFMAKQLAAAGNERYARELYDYVVPPEPTRIEPEYLDELPLSVLAASFLLSELNVAMMIGFAIFLPFLVIDLVVAAILSAMGLYLLPPSQVAAPLKLVVFALAEGWWLVSDMLLRSFAT